MAPEQIIISDDESTASSDASARPGQLSNLKGKRKLPADFEERLQWTDDEDDLATLKSRRASASRRRAKGRGRPKKQDKIPGRKTPAPVKNNKARGTPRQSGHPDCGAGDGAQGLGPQHEAPEEVLSEDELPEYLQRRRSDFNKAREILNEAGLKLPPDYDGIDFSDDDRPSLVTRPQLDKKSGVKPCRPREPVELEYSAGVIPAPIAQYLRPYQIDGVKFLHRLFVYQRGGILGDDMGLGKTVQVAAFLTVAFGKTGDERDHKRMRKIRQAAEDEGEDGRWYPRVLIICPGSLIENWKQELSRWGWWHIEVFHGAAKDDALKAAKSGRVEIMITTYQTYKNYMDRVNTVDWSCVVADECHTIKDRNSQTTMSMDAVNAMCRIGLTGTAIQNKYEELWTLLNWTNPGQFGTIAEWTATITKPLTVGQSHDATLHQLSLARRTAKKLVQNLLPNFFLRRMKSLIAHQLPKKSDKVVFCPLTDLQTKAYQNFLAGDNVRLILAAKYPCDCGSGTKRGWCCYRRLPEPDGRMWFALVFPTIMTLQKLANNLTLLIPQPPGPMANNEKAAVKQRSEMKTLKTCVPDNWEELYRSRDSMLTLSNPEFCGKWKILGKLLRFWHCNGDKALVFSHSVRLLRILNHLFNNTSYSVSYLDGSLEYADRQKVVDNFNSDPKRFVFLISTKAGGVGLNITSANKVVIFDPHWNPAYDLQAQDRAYRIGQVRDVDVFRLVSAGTIEEIVYARQIYKQQQANIGYNASSERRYFKGVQQDRDRKGEIFGLDNLFSFHADQVVLREIVNKTNVAEAKAGVNFADVDMEKMAEEEGAELDLMVKVEEGEEEKPGVPEDDDGAAARRLADFLTAEDPEELLRKRERGQTKKKPQSDAVAAILASAGVEYTHENSEVIGSSKVEAQLSRRAEMVGDAAGSGGGSSGGGGGEGTAGDGGKLAAADEERLNNDPLFPDSQANGVPEACESAKPLRPHTCFNPPVEVMRRQFCTMARMYRFANAMDFALVVENWTQEQRRNCLDKFYRDRENTLLEAELAMLKHEEEVDAKRGITWSSDDDDGEDGDDDDEL